MRIRTIIGLLFIGLQCISVLIARFIPEKFFCWAPYDEHTLIRTKILDDGKELSEVEIDERYRYRMNDWEPRTVNNVFNLITQYETTYGKDDDVIIIINYSRNGKAEKTWVYPKTSD